MPKFKRFEEGHSQKKRDRRREDFDKFESVTRRLAKKEKRNYNEDGYSQRRGRNYIEDSEDI